MIFSKKKTVTSKLNAHLPSVHPTNPLSKYHFVKIYYVKQMHICARCVCGREWLKKDPGGDIHTHILPLSSWPIPKKTSRIVSLTWIFFFYLPYSTNDRHISTHRQKNYKNWHGSQSRKNFVHKLRRQRKGVTTRFYLYALYSFNSPPRFWMRILKFNAARALHINKSNALFA